LIRQIKKSLGDKDSLKESNAVNPSIEITFKHWYRDEHIESCSLSFIEVENIETGERFQPISVKKFTVNNPVDAENPLDRGSLRPISGECNSFEHGQLGIAQQMFVAKGTRSFESHVMNYGWIKRGDEILDEVLLTVMRAPKSYTTEDVVEISCHGGTVSMKEILQYACH